MGATGWRKTGSLKRENLIRSKLLLVQRLLLLLQSLNLVLDGDLEQVS